jgi:cytochrome c-type biogenesis protein CcmE
MSRNRYYLLGGVLLVAFAGFALASFQESLTPYVSYQQAMAAGRTVQVAGALEQGSSAYDLESENLRFTLRAEQSGELMKVRYGGLKPANFEEAISIVAIGRWDDATEEFHADKLLVKCPSKYQGVEVKEYS